jgi:hypothetical protein
MQALATSISDIQSQSSRNNNRNNDRNSSRNNNSNSNNSDWRDRSSSRSNNDSGRGGNDTSRPPPAHCWSHGWCSHKGSACNDKRPGHIDNATSDNMQGGNTNRCHWL